jgi:hypothetical protein
MPQRGSQLLAVVGEHLRVVCAARNGNGGHAVVEQVFRSQLAIGVEEYPVGGLPLAAVTRRGVTAGGPDLGRLLRSGCGWSRSRAFGDRGCRQSASSRTRYS